MEYNFNFNDFELKWTNIDYETFEDFPHYYGVIFNVGNDRYQVIHSLLGHRLIINNLKTYECKDLPFNRSTEDFLPTGIKVIWSK